MPVRKNIPEAVDVRKRFLRSFEELRYRGLVKTKTEFSKNIGLGSTSNMNRMESERREPGVTNILLLHKKYNVSIDWIMFGKGDFFCEV
jgi:transcriptional regulator with XRE-family HTH domain